MFCLPDIGQTAHTYLSVPRVLMCAVWPLPPPSATITINNAHADHHREDMMATQLTDIVESPQPELATGFVFEGPVHLMAIGCSWMCVQPDLSTGARRSAGDHPRTERQLQRDDIRSSGRLLCEGITGRSRREPDACRLRWLSAWEEAYQLAHDLVTRSDGASTSPTPGRLTRRAELDFSGVHRIAPMAP
jgi:hypothetical protein